MEKIAATEGGRMDTLDNIRTFLLVARTGGFSAAAREMNTVPSVTSKRVGQLEHRLRAKLFLRSRRKLELTEAGVHYQQRFLSVMADLTAALEDEPGTASLQEHLRVKCPTTLSQLYFADVLLQFRRQNPGVRIDLVLMDRSVNPLEEGFDLAIGALPTTYPNVFDIPLCAMQRALVAAPGYLEARGNPQHPRELSNHDCIVFPATGSNWSLEGPAGPVTVEVNSVFSANDSHVLLKAVENELGLALIARHVADKAITDGRVVEVLPEFRVPQLVIKALVPENRRSNPTVQALLRALTAAFQPVPPWEREAARAGA